VRLLLLLAVVGCGSDIDAPDDCAAGELHVVHGTVDERVMITNFSFVNKLSESSLGRLDVGGASMTVQVLFDTLASNGSTVDARGSVTLNALDVGNCDRDGEFPGLLFVDDGSWRFELRELTMAPYCTGASVSASVRGCYRGR
jgi:hypothetical protein